MKHLGALIIISSVAFVFSSTVSRTEDRSNVAEQVTPVSETLTGGDVTESECIKENYSNLDQSKLNWEQFRSLEELDACIFWVAQSFSDRSRLVEWLKSNGLKVSEPSTIPSRSMKVIYNDERPGTQISGSTKPRDVNFNPGFFEMLFVYGMSVGIVLNADDIPVKTSSTLNRT